MLADIEIASVISRWLHLFAVITAVGGTVFIRLVLFPSAKAALSEEARGQLRPVLIRRWARVLHVAILVIILSGAYNVSLMFPQHKAQPLYYALFGVKMILVITLFFIAIALTGRSAAFEGLRKKASVWMAVNVLLAVGIVALSNVLKFIPISLGE